VYFEMGQPQGIAPTQCHVGAIPLDEPFALKYLFICASVLTVSHRPIARWVDGLPGVSRLYRSVARGLQHSLVV